MSLKGKKEFENKLDKVLDLAESTKLWGRIGYQAKDIIIERTKEGKDYQGRLFKGYSKIPGFFKIGNKTRLLKFGYKEYKRIKGNTKVNLQDSNQMMSSMAVKFTGRGATLFFRNTDEAKKAMAHNEGIGRMPKREFFNLSGAEQNKLFDLFRDELKKI